MGDAGSGTLILACGALAREIAALKRGNGWDALTVHYLPPELHNRPEQIPAAVEDFVRSVADRYTRILVGYADCGTGGALDLALERLRRESDVEVERIPGVHCYEFYAGEAVFAALAEAELGTFYLTDFLLRHFERLVIRGLGLDRHPELAAQYFGNYRRLVYLAQNPRDEDRAEAATIAKRMGWTYEYHETGYGGLAASVSTAARPATKETTAWPL